MVLQVGGAYPTASEIHARAAMSKRKEESVPEWRKFEMLIARLEQRLRPLHAVFKSPDRLLDTEIGVLREVDCSITFPGPNGSEVLSIECRRRGARQDVTWIEQLATKRRALNLTTTIAVSAAGFSPAAASKAAHHGLHVRTYRELQADPSQSPFELRRLCRTWTLRSFAYEVASDCPAVEPELHAEMTAAIEKASAGCPFIRILGTDKTLTLRGIVDSALDAVSLPAIEKGHRKSFAVSFVQPATFVCFPDCLPLTGLTFAVDVQVERVSIAWPVVGQYVSPAALLLETASWRNLDGLKDRELAVYFRTIERAGS